MLVWIESSAIEAHPLAGEERFGHAVLLGPHRQQAASQRLLLELLGGEGVLHAGDVERAQILTAEHGAGRPRDRQRDPADLAARRIESDNRPCLDDGDPQMTVTVDRAAIRAATDILEIDVEPAMGDRAGLEVEIVGVDFADAESV